MIKSLDTWLRETWILFKETYSVKFGSNVPFPEEPWKNWKDSATKLYNKSYSPKEAIDLLNK